MIESDNEQEVIRRKSLGESNTISPSLLRLNNLYAKSPDRDTIRAWISKDDHDYIVRGVLAGEHGAVQAILSHFWKKFVIECQRLELKPVWALDNKNPQRLAVILERMNFQDLTELELRLTTQLDIITSLQHDLARLQSPGLRRPNPRPPKPTKQPIPSDSKRRGTRSGSPKVPNASRSTKSPKRTSNNNSKAEAEGQENRRESPGFA